MKIFTLKKSIIFLSFALLFQTISFAQTQELWGIMGIQGGKIYKIRSDKTGYSYPVEFKYYYQGGGPAYGHLLQDSNGKFYGLTYSRLYIPPYNERLFDYDLHTGEYDVKVKFDSPDTGKNPHGSLTEALNGKFYGMTENGGLYNMGVLFEYNPSTEVFRKKIDFDGNNHGSNPMASLTEALNGKLYGMTRNGGMYGLGVLFEFDPAT